MSRRSSSRFIKTSDSTIYSASSRATEVELPVFSFSGVISEGSLSPPYTPTSDVRLTRWQVSAGIVGTSLNSVQGSYSLFQMFLGDNVFTVDGVLAARCALEGGEAVPWFGDTLVKPEGPNSYRANYNLDGYKGREALDTVSGIGYNDHIIVSAKQWIKVGCILSCGHEDISIKIFGEYINQNYDSGNVSNLSG